ncbi:MAG TPA: efflux RND transporter periplasmic adaptor subunit [Pseudolabrys sp.]|nr:efflux RND transporter periplasmic adaptor subunit [Pseudolabrys sp.]
MRKRTWFFGVAALALIGGGVFVHSTWTTERAAARAPSRITRAMPVELGKAVRKQVPVTLDALGTVTPIASVALKARIDTTIVGVHFKDGAHVQKGELLFTLDCRAIEAQIAQMEGMVARDKAQLAGAVRDVTRYTDLVAKGATPTVNLDNAKTQADVYRAAIESDQGQLKNLQVQHTYCRITAPITGRISAANVKVGNFVRQADTTPMATINQMAPVYVAFSVPQKNLPAIRQALANKSAAIEVQIPGSKALARGEVTMIDNTVDPSTGMATIRATMPNEEEALWPGTLVTVDLTLRKEERVVVPSEAVQVSQTGAFVFVVKNNVAEVQHVTVERQVGKDSVIASGLRGGETVVTDGQLRLSNGSKISAPGVKPPEAVGPRTAGS